MDARLIDRIETGIETGAASAFGGALAYAALSWPISSGPERWGYSAGAGILAFLLCLCTMRLLASQKPRLAVPVFDVRDIEPEFDELLLTESDRVGRTELVLTDGDRLGGAHAEALVLDDPLTEIGPGARVIRLFDPKSMPNAGAGHVEGDPRQKAKPQVAPSDASQALSDALAQLRRSLR